MCCGVPWLGALSVQWLAMPCRGLPVALSPEVAATVAVEVFLWLAMDVSIVDGVGVARHALAWLQ